MAKASSGLPREFHNLNQRAFKDLLIISSMKFISGLVSIQIKSPGQQMSAA